MAASVTIHSAAIFEDTSLTVMARVKGHSGTNITQASISSITCSVYTDNGDETGTLVTSPSVVVSSAVSDTLVTDDPRWTVDTTGYNFIHTIPSAAFPTPVRHRVEYKFTPASGDPFFLVVKVNVHALFQS